MAVVIYNTTLTAGAGSVGTRVLLHTATLGATLLVWTHSNEAVSCSAVAAGGVAMTRLHAVSAGTSRSELWGLTAAAAGTLTISAAQVGANVATWNLVATSYMGQRQQASPFGTTTGITATGTTANLSVSAGTGNIVVFGFGISANSTITLNNGTQRANATHSTTGRLVIGDLTATSSTVSISATAGASVLWGAIGIPIIAAPMASTITDDFSALDTAVNWFAPFTDLSASIGIASGRLQFQVAEHNNAAAILDGRTTVNLINDSTYIKLKTPFTTAAGSGGANAQLSFMLKPSGVGEAGGTEFGWHSRGDGNLVATWVSSFSANDQYSVTPTSDHAWLRIRSDGTNLLWDTAPNGADATIPGSWTNRASVALTTLPYPVTNCIHRLHASNFGGTTNPSGYGEFDGLNISANSEGVTNISATVAVTDVRDTVAAPGYVLIRGQAAVTDKPDVFAVPSRARITGQTVFTDVKDAVAIPAAVRIRGQVSVTDVRDVVAITGYNTIRGAVSVTDARDTHAATGYVLISAIAAVVDRMDTIAAIGSPASITGTVNVTDAPDTVAANAQVRITAAVNVTDKPDILAASAYLAGGTIFSTVNVTDAPDSIVVTGYLPINGAVNATDAPDSISVLINNISPSAEDVTTLIDSGSGGGGSKRKSKKPPYIRAPEDFWAIRERHLKSIHEEMVESAEPVETVPAVSIVPEPPKLVSYRIERASVIAKLKEAPDPPKLYNRTKRLKQLNANIAEQKRQQQLLAQKLAEQKRLEKKRRKLARARNLKKAVKLLAIARALSTLTYLYGKL